MINQIKARHSTRRLMLTCAALCGMLFTGTSYAKAASFAPYTEAAFKAALANHTPMVIHIEASWCPVCKQQQAILDGLQRDPHYATLEILDVDFDTQKPVVKQFGATMQSTLIAYHDGQPAQRAVGVTSRSAITALLNSAVGS
ncbi:MAG TPA: thioredoxin family protein [Acidocella sp.]|nr:thioredoxin family protein [Acidocella sp.]